MQRFVLVGIVCLSSLAHAGDSKAWKAAKQLLPGKLVMVAGVNGATLRNTDLYKQLVPIVLKNSATAAQRMGEIKDTCGTDPSGLVDSIVAGVDENGKGAVVIALRSWTQKDVESCLGKVAKAHAGKLVTEKSGEFTHYHYATTDKDRDLYAKWLAKDTVVVATDPSTKDALGGGGIAQDKDLAPLLAGTRGDAAVWMVMNKTQAIPQSTAKLTGMFMNADVKAGNVAVDAHVELDSEKGAADLATKLTAMKPMLTAQVPKMANLVKSMTFTAAGKEVVLAASDTEKDVIDIVSDMVSH